MTLLLHTPDAENELSQYYRQAFNNAVELFIVTAYLTEWDGWPELNADCLSFRIIIGRDFGITRKAACRQVMRWLPANRRAQFMVADGIDGFHPKAVFWKEADGNCFAIVGSSNLTRAAFQTNHEANTFSKISRADFTIAKRWIREIEKLSVVVSEDWLERYNEAVRPNRHIINGQQIANAIAEFTLPRPPDMDQYIDNRRMQLAVFMENRDGLIRLFRRCALREISSNTLYNQLPQYWSYEVGDRLQGAGWERRGAGSNFRLLSKSFVRIYDAVDEDRDDIVIEEIDRLAELGIPTRKAFLSEMLCLNFPDQYPVLNAPVWEYIRHVKLRAPRGASEGVRYIDLARKLRFSILQNPDHPAKNLAELDTIIWLEFGN